MYSEKYCDEYFLKFIPLSPTYVYGANISQTKSAADFDKLYKQFGSENGQYNRAYYDNKFMEASKGSGWISDCSGLFCEISGRDRTAHNYFGSCVAVGPISTIDLKRSCCVFRGTASKITHMGYYCASTGEVLEMANSTVNFRHKAFSASNWTFWGKPDFIDYSSSIVTFPTQGTQKAYLHKGIDMSSYQKNVNYQALKKEGVEFAILKIINKQLQKDSMFETHLSGCTTNGIKVPMVYNYVYTTNKDQAIQAAKAVISTLDGLKAAVCMDIEDAVMTRLGSGITDVINAYQDTIEAAGLNFYLYAGLSFWKSYIAPYSAQLRCLDRIWCARYYNSYNPMDFSQDPNELYKPLNNIVGWQYSSSGKIPSAYNGNLDFDVLYKEIVPTVSNTIVVSPQTPVRPQIGTKIKNTVRTKGANLNVRNKPNTSGQVVGKLKNGSDVVVYGVDKDTGWLRLAVTEEKWCSPDYVEVSAKGIITVENSVYIRSADSKAGDIWGFYKNGETVPILHISTNTSWYLTPKGWVSNKYVKLL